MGVIRRVPTICLGFLVILFSLSTQAEAGGFSPPVSIDMGSAVLIPSVGEAQSGKVFTAALKWATIYPARTSIDIGVGYIGTVLEVDEQPVESTILKSGRTRKPSLSSMHGGFLEISSLLAQRDNTRAWVGGRAELLNSNGEKVVGLATRISGELWVGMADGGGGGAVFGVGAIGVWTEIGARWVPSFGLVRQLSIGLSVRLPMVVAN